MQRLLRFHAARGQRRRVVPQQACSRPKGVVVPAHERRLPHPEPLARGRDAGLGRDAVLQRPHRVAVPLDAKIDTGKAPEVALDVERNRTLVRDDGRAPLWRGGPAADGHGQLDLGRRGARADNVDAVAPVDHLRLRCGCARHVPAAPRDGTAARASRSAT